MDDMPVEGGHGLDHLQWWENSRLIMTEQAPLPKPRANGSMAPVDLQGLPLQVQAALFAVQNGTSPETATRWLSTPGQVELFWTLQLPPFRSVDSPGFCSNAVGYIDPNVSPPFCTMGNAMMASTPRPEHSSWSQSSGTANDFSLGVEPSSPGNQPQNQLHGNHSPPESPEVNCPDCGKPFKGRYARSNMRRHQKHHCKAGSPRADCGDGPRKKMCDRCGREYIRGDGLTSHRKKAHCDESPTQL